MTRAEYDVKNDRRIALIFREHRHGVTLDTAETAELEKLQQECMAFVQAIAPVPRIQDDSELMAAAEKLGWKPKP